MAIDYKSSGVDVERGYEAVKLMNKYIKDTYDANVIGDTKSFGAIYALDSENCLVSGTDGVGTKLKYAFSTGRFDTIGIDCVAMCVNDILCCGARPLFFLDYIATSFLDPVKMSQIVKGVSIGCKQAGAALIGGETAEMPGFYAEGEFDIAGFAVGIVKRDKLIDGSKMVEGDRLIGLESSGIHSNGFSLVRQLFPPDSAEIDKYDERLGCAYIDMLLEPTRIYVKPVLKLIDKFDIHGLAHITGGGMYEKLMRIFPDGLSAVIYRNSYPRPEIFKLLQERAGITDEKMFNTFNMGIGMVIAARPEIAGDIISEAEKSGVKAYDIGEVTKGKGLKLC
ncbi:MAG: phosphoribosylformylglycinamidine cyclo-ligase [Christensenellales bacterium]|jgi:phosphoribosylformylglycinamidine cyclo-ligase